MSRRVSAALWFARLCIDPLTGNARRRVGIGFLYLCYFWALAAALLIAPQVAVLTFWNILVDFHRTVQADIAYLKRDMRGDTAGATATSPDDVDEFARDWAAASVPSKIIVGDEGKESAK